jgi:hypothetical protein
MSACSLRSSGAASHRNFVYRVAGSHDRTTQCRARKKVQQDREHRDGQVASDAEHAPQPGQKPALRHSSKHVEAYDSTGADDNA